MIRKLFKYLGVLVGVVVLGIAGLFVFIDFDDVLNDQLQEHKGRVEAALGRKVAFGAVKSTFFPLGAQLTELTVAGRTPEEPPLLRLESARFRIDLWKAIKSAGSEARLQELVLDGLVVHLVREADGSLSYDDVLERLAEGPPADEASEPLTAEQKNFIKNLVLDRVAITNSEVHLEDRATGGAPANTYVKELDIEVGDLALVSPFEVKLSAAIVAEEPNLEVKVRLGPIPIGAPGELPVHRVQIKADGIDLARLAPYLGDAVPVTINSARFSADLDLDDPLARTGPMRLAGSLNVAQVALGNPAGTSFDFSMTPTVTFDPKADVLTLRDFRVALGDMTVFGTGVISQLSAERPRFDGLKFRTEKLDFTRLMQMLPPVRAALPPGTKLAGPFSAVGEASGTPDAQSFVVKLDFDAATMIIPGALAKPEGVPLHLDTKADLAPDSLKLHRLDLGLGPMALDLKGSVKNFTFPIINLQGDTGRFDINGLVRLIPAVQSAVPPDVKIAGAAQVKVSVAGTAAKVQGDMRLGLYGANLAVPGLTLKGTGEVLTNINGVPGDKVALTLTTDLAGLDVRAGEDFIKPAGTPLSVRANATQTPGAVTIKSMDVTLGPLHVTGSATLGNVMTADITVDRFQLEQLARLLPALQGNAFGKATVGAKLRAKGTPSAPATMEADLQDIYFGMGKNTLTGSAQVKNLDAPRIRFDFNSPYLNLDALLPAGDPKAPDSGPPTIPPVVKTIDAEGGLRVGRGVFGGIPFANFVAQLTLKGGVLRFAALDFDAYEGRFSGARTEANLGAPTPTFAVRMNMKNVSAAKLLAEQANLRNAVTGRLSTEIDVKGRGLVWEQMSQSLTGDLGMDIADGSLATLDLEKSLLAPVAAVLPLLNVKKLKSGTAFKSLAGTFQVRDGKLELKRPMEVSRGRGGLTLSGGIGLDKSLALRGKMQLAPQLLRTISGGKLRIQRPIPVDLQIGGTLLRPKITGVDVTALANEVAKAAGLGSIAGLKAKAVAEAQKKLDEAKAKAKAELDKAKAKAMAEVDKAKAAAEKRVDAAKERARREADKAKKRAEDEVKKRAKGMLDKLF